MEFFLKDQTSTIRRLIQTRTFAWHHCWVSVISQIFKNITTFFYVDLIRERTLSEGGL